MKYDTGKFEGGYRLSYIHRTKRFLFIAQAFIVLVFAIYLLMAGGGLSFVPFFLSVNSFLYFVLIMLLVIALESFFFIMLEMRFMKSDGTKFITTQRSFRSSVLLAVVMLVILIIFWTPVMSNLVGSSLDSEGSISVQSSTTPGVATMFNYDALGLTGVESVELTASGSVEVFILTEDNYKLFKDSGKDVLGGYRINEDYLATPSIFVDFPETAYSRFYILVYSEVDVPIAVDYTINQRISGSLMNYLPVIALLFLIAYALWAVYMFILNKRFVHVIYR